MIYLYYNTIITCIIYAESEYSLAVYTAVATVFIIGLNLAVLFVCIYSQNKVHRRNASEAEIMHCIEICNINFKHIIV